MPYLHVYIIMFQDAWSTSHTSQVHRKKDDGRQLEAEENQGVDIMACIRLEKERVAEEALYIAVNTK